MTCDTEFNYTDKRVGETEILSVDYAALLATGETITSATWSVSVRQGVDANPAAMLVSTASIAGAVVSQKITGGVAGVYYWPICTAVTSLGQTLVLPDPGAGSLRVVA